MRDQNDADVGFAGLPAHLQPRGGRDLPLARERLIYADACHRQGVCEEYAQEIVALRAQLAAVKRDAACAREIIARAACAEDPEEWLRDGLAFLVNRPTSIPDVFVLAARERALEEALCDASRFILTDETITLNADTNRLVMEIIDRRRDAGRADGAK